MRRLAAICACLLPLVTGPGLCYGAAHTVAQQTTPLESLGFVTSAGVVTDTPSHPGLYHRQQITRGLQIGPAVFSNVTFALKGQYETLTGIVYVNDAQKGVGSFSIAGVSTQGAKNSLFTVSLGPGKQASFKISVHNVNSLTLTTGTAGFFDVVADLTVGNAVPPVPAGPQVIVRYPTGGAGVAAASQVPFAWNPFPQAVNYVLQLWLIKPTGTTPITAATPVTLSTLVYHKTSYVWDNRGFPPGTYQYDLIPLDAAGNALAPRSNPQQITVAS